MQETFNLATFYNIQFKQDPIKFWLKKIENMPYEMTSSMHEDYKRNMINMLDEIVNENY